MKIDFIVSSLRDGGAERVLVILANELAARGHSVSIITFLEEEKYSIDDQIQRIRLNEKSHSNQTFRYFINLFKHYKKKKNRPDIAVSFLTQTNLTSILVCRLFRIKIIASEHTNHLRTSTNAKIVQFTRKYVYKLADKVTILTSFDLPFYTKYRINTVVLPNPCTFEPITDTDINRKKEILAVGNLDRYHIKGFDNLLRIIAPVLKAEPDWYLNFIGGGDEGHHYLKKLVEEFDIAENVIFSGFSKNVAHHMAKSEIFVLSSRTEGLPMALLEAMSQGMACIAYDCVSGPSDIISNDKNGLLIDNQNEEAMKKGLLNLINDKNKRSEFQKVAQKSISRFQKDNVCDEWEVIMNEIIN